MTKVGVYFGTFAPLHIGHLQEIYKCATENEKVLVIVSGYTDDRGAQIGLPLAKRLAYLQEAFKDEPNFVIAGLNETDLPPMPHGWDEWTKRLYSIIFENIAETPADITFYVGEVEYVKELIQRFPEDMNHYQVEIANRLEIPISATKIRGNSLRYWQFIHPVFRQHFTKYVTVLDNETLLRRLAYSSNSPLVTTEMDNISSNSGIVFVKNPIHIENMDIIFTENSETKSKRNTILLDDKNEQLRFYHSIDALNEQFKINIPRLGK
ncbi:transcriptional regulator [Lactococcus nasutitermitis]|uniref:Transcriptional regulator n=1 Tax=Lactococcus nasutitermitis TaxID=1652957 RepID=A0ABV9JAZ2_9LACT|nr:transcriptional regulator [Lactococcus nasutitermitis]